MTERELQYMQHVAYMMYKEQNYPPIFDLWMDELKIEIVKIEKGMKSDSMPQISLGNIMSDTERVSI